MELFDLTNNSSERSMIISGLLPNQINDSQADWLLDKINDPDVAIELKRQISSNLVLSALLEEPDSKTVPASLLGRTNSKWHPLYEQTFKNLKRLEPGPER